MDAKGKRVCLVCGAALRDDSDSCPVCALRGVLAPETASLLDTSSELHFEHYEVLKNKYGKPFELGRGAMGVTYKAIDVKLRSVVALKVIGARFIGDESARRRFVREARAAASVRHPNVAWVIHLGESGGNYFYVMEFVDGESLDKVIRRSNRLDTSTALKVVTLVAAGLEAIQKQNLVHRDIKPSNIMVSLEGNKVVSAKIIDLGLAKGAPEEEAFSAISSQGVFAGTPQYASPEQFAGMGADIRSDLYSLGITLWEMLIGQTPFRGSPTEVMYQHQQEPLPIEQLKGVPQPVIALLEVLLEKDSARRLQSPADLLNALPKVNDAVKARHIITHKSLREITDQRLGASGKAIEVLTNLREAIAGRRVRMILWPAIMLVIGGGAILAVNIFFAPKRPSTQASRSSLPAVAAEKSIAVLPFESLSENKSDSYFADGVQGEILNNLAKIAQLKVISRTSVMQYRANEKKDLRQIASALGVANVLEGTVRRDGNHVRVSTELIDARNDNTIWADSYDRDLTDIFVIQSEVAQTIASKLTATLSPQEKRSIEARPTNNLEAYDLYLRAKELASSAKFFLKAEALHEVLSLLDQAIHLDPKFTRAYCEAADVNAWLYRSLDPSPERRALAAAAIEEARRLQPDLPEVRLAFAFHLYDLYRDYERARVQLAIARRSLPNSSEAMLLEAYLDRRQGNWEKALSEFREATALDPRNQECIVSLAFTLEAMRRFTESEQAYDRAIDLLPNEPILKLKKAILTFLKTGDTTEERKTLAALSGPTAEDPNVLFWRVDLALRNRDWNQIVEIIEKMNGAEDVMIFSFVSAPVPADCYLIFVSRLKGKQPAGNPAFAKVREQLNEKFQMSEGDLRPMLLSQLAIVDALLEKKGDAITEARRAADMLPISRDALDGPGILLNLAVVYAWADKPDLAFATLVPMSKIPCGTYYGDLKFDPYWDPLRKDPRFEKLLAELAPKD